MQILLDTETESRDGLLLTARVLMLLAGVESLEVTELAARPQPKPLQAPPTPPVRPTAPTPPPPSIPLPPGAEPPAPVEHPPFHPDATPPVGDVPAGTQPELDPAAVFGGNGPLVATAAAVPAAPPAGAPVAATVPTVPTVPASASSERDKRGFPWDARIHSETRKQNADGTWRYRRNLDPAVKAAVDAELQAQYGAQVSLPQQPAAVVTSAVPVPPAAPAVPVAPTAAVAVPVPPAPAVPAVPAAPAAVAASVPLPPAAAVPVQPAADVRLPNSPGQVVLPPVANFRDLMQKVNTNLAAGKLTQVQLTEACKAAGVDSVAALAAQPAKVPDVDANLNAYLSRAA